jgi:hypothetical protein
MNPDQDAVVQKEVTANRVVAELMAGKNSIEDMKVLGKPMFTDLIMHMHDNKDKSRLMALSLEALAEHAALLSLLNRNLVEATKLLESHNIPFDSMVTVDES